MNLKTKFACGLATLMLPILAACTQAPPVTGVLQDKYIEDGTEYTIVVKEDVSNDVHHFTIDDDQWRKLKVGDRINSNTLDAPEEDD